jgi:3-oxoacyl-[acyl-carrier protein] reductase
MGKLDSKRAIITGASQGIGRAVALRLASEGASVALTYHTNREGAVAAVQTITSEGGRALAVHLDVAVAEETESVTQAVVDAWGGVDILVNNAGITRDSLLLRMSEDQWQDVVDTNLKGAFLCTKAVLRHMVRQRWGRIINMSSVVALTGNVGQANYAAAKAGLIGLSRSVAREVATRNITANAITPGFIDTQMVERLTVETQATIKQLIPMGRFGSTGDVAALVAFLASDDAAYITGQALSVDGGLSL